MKLTKRQISIAGSILACLLLVYGATNLATIWPERFGRNTESQLETNSVVDSQPLPAMQIHKVDSFVRSITHTGVVETANQTMVAFQRDGLVTELLVDEGQRVEADQELALLDSRLLSAQLESLDARWRQAKSVLQELQNGPREEVKESARNVVLDLQAQLKAQEERLSRSESLVRTNSIAQQDYERELYARDGLAARLKAAESQFAELDAGTRPEQIEAQKALVKSMQAEKQAVEYSLEDCKLKAPFAGMVVRRFIDPGSVVAAGSPVFELIDDHNLEIHVGVPQTLASRLSVGSTCNVLTGEVSHSADPPSATPPRGTVRSVLPILDQNTRTARVIIDIQDDGENVPVLFTGQVVNVEFFQTVRDDGFWIPRSALSPDHGGLWSCIVVEGDHRSGKAVKQSVEVLHQREDWVFVRGTLRDGQVIVSGGLTRFVPNQQIAIQVSEPIPPTYLSTLKPPQNETTTD